MKKIIALLLGSLLLISLFPAVYAAEIPQTLEAPSSLMVRYDNSWGMLVRWTEPESISKLYAPGPDKVLDNCFFEIDVKINDGQWRQEGKTWGPESDIYGQGPFLVATPNQRRDVNGVMETFITSNHLGDFSLEKIRTISVHVMWFNT